MELTRLEYISELSAEFTGVSPIDITKWEDVNQVATKITDYNIALSNKGKYLQRRVAKAVIEIDLSDAQDAILQFLLWRNKRLNPPVITWNEFAVEIPTKAIKYLVLTSDQSILDGIYSIADSSFYDNNGDKLTVTHWSTSPILP